MFENLQEKLQRAFKTLRGQATLSEENIQEALRQIRLALLEADVNFKVVKQLIDQIQAKAVGQKVMTALSPGEQVIKIVRDELVAVLGTDTAKMKFASQPPTVVLMAGLQGSGKTTTSGKLAEEWRAPPLAGFGGRVSPGRAAAVESRGGRNQGEHLRGPGYRAEYRHSREAGEGGAAGGGQHRERCAHSGYRGAPAH